MKLADMIVSTAILDGGPAVGKAELIRQLLHNLATDGHISANDVPDVLDAVMRREATATSGIGAGVAVPHLKHVCVVRKVAILALCRPPVDFDSIDGRPTDIVVLLLAPSDKSVARREDVRLGSELIRRLCDSAFTDRIRNARTAADLSQLVQDL